MTPAPGMPLPVTFCAWEGCRRVFRPGRTDQECCTVTCENRRKRALHPSTKPSRATAPVRYCKAKGCTLRVRTEADFCSEHNGSRHGRAGSSWPASIPSPRRPPSARTAAARSSGKACWSRAWIATRLTRMRAGGSSWCAGR